MFLKNLTLVEKQCHPEIMKKIGHKSNSNSSEKLVREE